MGKRKRMIERCGPARERSQDLRAECQVYGVRDIYDLPVHVHWHHRARRLRESMISPLSRVALARS